MAHYITAGASTGCDVKYADLTNDNKKTITYF